MGSRDKAPRDKALRDDDRLDKILRNANPVREEAEPPHAPLLEFRQAHMPAPVEFGDSYAPRSSAAPAAGRLLPALAAVVATVLVTAAAFAAYFALTRHSPEPISPFVTETPSSDDWRLGSILADPQRRPETLLHFRIPPGWLLDDQPSDPDSADPDYPAATIYVTGPSNPEATPEPHGYSAMAYYGPLGGRYDPAACLAPAETYTELDSLPVSIPFDQSSAGAARPRFVYRVVNGSDGKLIPSFGITMRPPGTGTDPCTQYFLIRAERPGYYFMFSTYLVLSGTKPGWMVPGSTQLAPDFSTIEEARAFLESRDYQAIKRVFTSVTITAP